MRFMEMLRKRQKGDKGFSLVELVIVIAIMAILVGIVGAQVIPYLNRSRVAKDQQVLSSYLMDAVSAFSMNAEEVEVGDTILLEISSGVVTIKGTAQTVVKETFAELAGADASPGSDATFTTSISSRAGQGITDVTITCTDTGVTLSTTGGNADLYTGAGNELKTVK